MVEPRMLENNLDHFNKIYCLHQVTCSQCLFKQQLALPHGPRWSRLHREVPLNSSTYSKGKSHFFPITPSFPKDDWILQSDTPSALWMWYRQVRMHIRLRSDDQTFKAEKVSYTFFMNLQKNNTSQFTVSQSISLKIPKPPFSTCNPFLLAVLPGSSRYTTNHYPPKKWDAQASSKVLRD